MRQRLRKSVGVLALAAALTGLAAIPASADSDTEHAKGRQGLNLFGAEYSLQNYFNFAGNLTPFFDEFSGEVIPPAEITWDDGYIYEVDIDRRSVSLRWNPSPAFDAFEPYVGQIAGFTQEEAAGLPMADEYWISFDESLDGYTPFVDPRQPLALDARIVDDYTLVLSIPGGTDIGDGIDGRVFLIRDKARG